VQTNSRSFSLAEKADIMIQEQMSDTLFGENMIENILDLKTRILKPSGRILPGKFEVFFEPVSLKKEYRIPFIWENKIHGLDFGCLRNDHELEQYKPDNYQCRTLPVAAIDYFLCDPVAAFSFDLNEWTPSTKIPQMVEASRKVIRAGSLDGLIFYFRTIFNDEISFDTSPLSRHTSWAHRFFRAKSRDVREGEEVSYTVDLTDILYAKQWKLMFK
jgi:protein arginine N-methyltransferase 1